MLFVESMVADFEVAPGVRLGVLDALQERGLVPLIRAARLHGFERALAGAAAAEDLERAVAGSAEAEGEAPYVVGDLFCSDDFAHFLLFGDEAGEAGGLRAGIAYVAETDEPARKLEEFCRNVREAVEAASPAGGRVEWRQRVRPARDGFARFAATAGDASKAPAPTRGTDPAAGSRAAELLRDPAARALLRSLSEAQADGFVAGPALASGRGPGQEELVARLAGAGLVRREVQVTCRKGGRSLFRLPSAEALSMVTASNAVCSECGGSVADERAEELVTPTPLATSMLKDGAWMLDGVRAALAGLGLPAGAVASRADGEGGEAQLLADVCGEPFLFVLREGDFTTAHARRALEAEAETQATRLVVVSSGKVHEEARGRLREHARRRARAAGEGEGEVIFVAGAEGVAAALREPFDRASREAVTRELFELDASAGFNVGHMLAARFRLGRRPGGLRDLAASAAGALAGSLSEL